MSEINLSATLKIRGGVSEMSTASKQEKVH